MASSGGYPADVEGYLRSELKQRIFVLDGGMGTMIQVRSASCAARQASAF
jgi:methionine synthase I (cobalamin-dependent)